MLCGGARSRSSTRESSQSDRDSRRLPAVACARGVGRHGRGLRPGVRSSQTPGRGVLPSHSDAMPRMLPGRAGADELVDSSVAPVKRPGPEDFRVDAMGRRRRLCDSPCLSESEGPRGRRCSDYATRALDDGRMTCARHDPDREKCAHPVAWGEDGAPVRFCARGRRYFVHRENAWYCKQHDPDRPRCEQKDHDPRATPRAVRKTHDGRHLCAACFEREPTRFIRSMIVQAPACNLCGTARVLERDDGSKVPCVCTPAGRELVNGRPDAVVLAELAT